MDKYSTYQQNLITPDTNHSWLLKGAGFEAFVSQEEAMPVPEADEMLMRVDAVSICFSDVKLVKAGNDHPRVLTPLEDRPTVPGHEVSLTVIEPGSKWVDTFTPGGRFLMQADVFKKDGSIDTFGYTQRGGMALYVLLKVTALDGQDGCYLLPLNDETGFSEAALAEPWACVESAYHISRATGISDDDTVYCDPDLRASLPELSGKPVEGYAADRLFISAQTKTDEYADQESKINDGAVITFVAESGGEKVAVDAGSLHYRNFRLLSCTPENALDAIKTEDRQELVSGGKAFFAGAGGPMGQMHVQRAFELQDHPGLIAVSDISEERLEFIRNRFSSLAEQKGIEFKLFNAGIDPHELQQHLLDFSGGFDDINILAPVPALVTQSQYLANKGALINIFAGIPIGSSFTYDTKIARELELRFTGSSGSAIEDLQLALDMVQARTLNSNGIVRAIGGFKALKEGVQAVSNGMFPGKVIIYPHLSKLPLTSLDELEKVCPEAAADLDNGNWTTAAEKTLFNTLLE